MSAVIDPRVDPLVMSYTDKILQNAEVALKSGSTYVVLVAGILGALYASMTTAQQTAFVEAWPILKGWTPAISVVITFIVAKLKPSDTISSSTKSMIEELARLRMNAFLRDRGSAELPAPLQATLPVSVPIVAPVVTVLEAALPEPSAPIEPPIEPPPATPPAPPQPVSLTRVDIKLPQVDPPTPMPIDPRLLLSLIRDYLVQTAPKP